MKKWLSLLVGALLCAMLMLPAFADMGGPEMIGYTVTTQADTDYYNWEWNEQTDESVFKKAGVIPAGTTLRISYESKENGVLYGYFYDGDGPIDGVSGYVRISDVKTPSAAYPKEKGYKQSTVVRLRVTEPKGLTLRSGPSETYPVVATIPAGTELACDTVDNTNYETGAWMYLTYGGKGGWAHCWLYDGAYCPAAELLPKGMTATCWAVKQNAALVDAEGNTVVSVPKGEKLTVDSFNRQPYTMYYHATYGGKSGIVVIDSDGFDDCGFACSLSQYSGNDLTYNSVTLEKTYVNPDDRIPAGMMRFKANEKIKWQYLYYADPPENMRGGVEWYYVEKDGRGAWISPTGDYVSKSGATAIPSLASSSTGPRDTGEDFTLPERTTEESTTLPEYVPENLTEAPTETQTAPENTYPQFETTEFSPETTTAAAAVKEGRPMTPVTIILICAAAAAILSLTAFVTLQLIRRKRG